MIRNLRQTAVILIVVSSFFALSFAAGVESAQTKKPKSAPTPAKKTAKATPTPSKKTSAKATPSPSKKTTASKAAPAPKNSKEAAAKTKAADKKSTAKSTAKDASKDKNSKDKNSKDKNSAKSKQASAKAGVKETDKKTADKKTADKKAAASKSSKADSKTSAKNSKSQPIAGKSSSKTTAAKTATTKTASKSPERTVEKVSDEVPQIIVTDVAARIRSQARSSAPELTQAKLGTVLQVSEKTPAWYRVQFTSGARTSSGWISANSVNDLNSAGKEQIYRQIAERYYKNEGMNFATASELYEFLTRAASETGNSDSAELGLKRLLALRSALKAVPAGKSDENPYRDFLKAQGKNVVYSEPSGQWMAASSLFWDLHKKYAKSPLADQIAWEGAQNPLPGECEGYVNCHLFYIRMTAGEYLSLHPNGKRNLEALTNLTNSLEPIVSSLTERSVYTGPTDVTDRAEFNNLIAEIRTIVSRLPLTEKEKPLQHLKKIAEGFR